MDCCEVFRWSLFAGLVFLSQVCEKYLCTGQYISPRSSPACSHVISLPAISPALCAHKEQFPECVCEGGHQISSMQVKILSLVFPLSSFLSLSPIPSSLLAGLLSERWLPLIKELIFSPLSLISIVNLKHCEFFKFSFPVIKKRKRENRGYLIV